MKYVIGIDLGTSGVKALLLSEQGSIVDIKTSSYTPDFGAKGFVEQDPEIWIEHTKKVLADIMKANADAKGNVVSLSCSGQMHSSVFVDKSGQVIRKAILWNDTRTTKQTKEIYAKAGGVSGVLEKAYNLALEGFTLPKILWLRENEPENFAKVDKVIMPKDYINYRLTGNIFTDVSDAAGTLLFDVKNRRWSAEMLEAVGLSAGMLPEALESTGCVGNIVTDVAEELGLSTETKVIAGGADNSCAAIGNGVVKEGEAVISVGTSGTVVAFLDGIHSEVTGAVHLFNYSYPGSSYAMGCMLSAGECLNWLKRSALADKTFDEMNVLAENVPIGSNGLIFLPYLFGERCPHTDADARGVFFGISGITGQGELARAVMEGVAFGLKDMFELVKGFADMKEIYITGGGAKSKLWGGIIADILGRELTVLNVEEGPAFGAALIAAVGSGLYKSFDEAKAKTVEVVKTIKPNESNTEEYTKYYGIFRELYQANKDIFKKLSQI